MFLDIILENVLNYCFCKNTIVTAPSDNEISIG
jgi:hypothetical protein